MERRLLTEQDSFFDGSHDKIAIIGAACRLPGAPDLRRFEELLFSGRDAVTEIPDERWAKPQYFHPEPGQRGKAYTFAAGVIDQIYGFDAGFFGIAPREAVQVDPQQRLLLELAHEAIEDAGLNGAALAGTPVGVYVGGSSWDHLNLHIGDPSAVDAYSMTGATLCSLSNRLSYIFDLRGPSMTVDTACSSSLVALHLACEAIREGRVSAALVGGVNLLLAPHSYVGFCRASMLSRRGRCHAFDARADGYVRAEGGGVVVLKPLRAALAAGDRIRAVVRATGVNSDGRTTGFSLPNKDAQETLLRETYGRFGIVADELDYLEAHGTGTPVGDPIEAGAIGRVLGQARSTALPIGSVKTNIGHLEAGSGMAGLLKALLVLQNRVIPRSLHCETPNPAISFEALNLALVPEARSLRANGHLPAVGINSFGFGGTNAHAVLGTAPLVEPPAAPASAAVPPLLLSARSQAALRALVAAWRGRLNGVDPNEGAALLRAAARRREHHGLRFGVLADSPGGMVDTLDRYLDGADGLPVASGTATSGDIAFVFSGNGSQWIGMGLEAMRGNAAFRAGMAKVDAALRPLLGWSVQERLGAPDLALHDTEVAQPLLFAVEVAAVEALRAVGIHPAACMGHSVGEVAAAWASGCLTLAEAAQVIHCRSHRQQVTHGDGTMAVLGLPIAAATEAAVRFGLEVAAENASSSVTVAGPADAITALAEEAKRRGWGFTRLDLAYAFHSAAMEPIRDPLLADLAGLAPHAAAIPFVSTVTGAVTDGTALDADYWWDNVRRPVRFAAAARSLIAGGTRLFLEIGPQPVLQSYLHDALRAAATPGVVLAAMARRSPLADPFAFAALRCHVAGYDISRTAAFDGPVATEELPAYPWQRESFRLERTEEATDLIGAPIDHPLLGIRTGAVAEEWLSHLDTATQPWLADHVVGGAPVLPAAGMIGMMLAAARIRHPGTAPLEILDLEIDRALPLLPGQTRAVRTRIVADERQVSVASRTRLQGEAWMVHATGRIGAAATGGVLRDWPKPEMSREIIPAAALYRLAADLGLEYGPAFRTVAEVAVLGETEALVRLAPVLAQAGPLDATLLDGALQGLLVLAARRIDPARGQGMMPWRFGKVRLLGAGMPVQARLRITQAGPRSVAADILLLDADGAPLAELLECWFVAVALRVPADPAQRCLCVDILDGPDPAAPPLDATLIDVALDAGSRADGDPVAAALAEAYVAARADAALRALAAERDAQDAAPLRVQDAAPLRARMLDWLRQDGIADAEGTLAPSADLPPADELLRSLLFDVPTAGADAALLAAAGEALEPVLRTGAARPKPPAALLDQFLHHGPAGRLALESLAEAAVAVARAWPAGRSLSILELGSGGSTVTRMLARRLKAVRPGLRYVAATIGTLQAGLATIDGVTPQVWNPEVVEPRGFDLVLSLHGLTRLGFGTAELAALRDRLAPGALLLAIEPLPNRVWDLIGIPGNDETPVAPHPAEVWTEMLAVAGFDARSSALAASVWPSVLLAAQSIAVRPAPSPLPGRLLLAAASADALADALAATLRRQGAGVAEVALDELHRPGTVPAMLAGAAGLILLLPDPADAADWLGRVAGLVEPLVTAAVPLTLVSRGKARGEVFAAALGGLRRVVANEAAGLRVRSIRLSRELASETAAARLAAELLSPDAEDEIAWSTTGRQIVRFRPGLPVPPPAAGGASALSVERPGLLGTLRWKPSVGAAVGADEVAISVRAAGLNFRDVMWAMGLLPDEALLHGFAGPTLGLECAGVVVGLGRDVTDLALGDAVMAFAPASLGTETVTRRHAVARLPGGMDFAAGATIPVAFFTVAYALGELARLEAGERVLIHGGAGGVGLAAIQYARHRGAEVFATAGSESKRALLRQLGVEHVLNSRDLGFADAILSLTGGEGVDVVLNSLSGEAMERSLGLLRPFGRFLELGKRDFYRNTPMGIRPLRHNASYFAIDADQLPLSRPALARRLLGEIVGLLETGALRPLPYRSFGFDEAVDAFRLMQSSGHVGKIVLEPAQAPAAAVPDFIVCPDATYLVTGGLAGFGLATARWLARRGARHLALLGRRGEATPGAAEALDAFAAAGVEARAFACDVADEAALAATLETLRTEMPALHGVVHAAMVMDDAFIPALDAARFAAVLAPKARGAEALDRLTRDDPIELFLLFSSVTTALGNPGQASYVAANAALEAVAERRHAAGLPALAVGWGPIGDAGYLTRSHEVSEALARRLGTAHLRADEALDALPAMLAARVPVLYYADFAGARRKQLPLLGSPLFELLPLADGVGEEERAGDLRTLVAGRPLDEARRVVAEALAEEIASILQLPVAQVDASRRLADYGMDSLMAVELRTAVETRFGVNLPLFSLSEGVTLAGMAARLVDPLFGNANADPAPSVASAALALARVRYENVAESDETVPVLTTEVPTELISVSA
ncbi:type I polyketide synthase [Rhodopila sp.]|uniref:type I polyketide synthase n=1 Tax=Rhodopila sp. TaxID=2480087 RepID=UPI003D0FFD55